MEFLVPGGLQRVYGITSTEKEFSTNYVENPVPGELKYSEQKVLMRNFN